MNTNKKASFSCLTLRAFCSEGLPSLSIQNYRYKRFLNGPVVIHFYPRTNRTKKNNTVATNVNTNDNNKRGGCGTRLTPSFGYFCLAGIRLVFPILFVCTFSIVFAQYEGGDGRGGAFSQAGPFPMLPTPTPTSTATPTPTSTATLTPTITPSATPTLTPTVTNTVTPSATPTVPPKATSPTTPSATPLPATPTPTVTSTVTPVPTSLPTSTSTSIPPTATPAADFNGLPVTTTIRDENGLPVSNAVVVVYGVGTFVSDDSGELSFNVPFELEQKSLDIEATKVGYTIEKTTFSPGVSSTIELKASSTPYPRACKLQDISDARAELDTTTKALFDFSTDTLTDLKQRKEQGFTESVDELTQKERKLSLQFKKTQILSVQKLPSARLSCPRSEVSCRGTTLKRTRKKYARLIKRGYRTFVSTLKKLRRQGVITKAFLNAQKADARLRRRLALNKLRRLKLATSLCN